MGKFRNLTLAFGALVTVLTATDLAAQNRDTAPEVQSPMMGQGQGQGTMPMMGMMQQMSQMMETCNRMIQAHMSEPHHQPQPQSNQ